MCLLAVMCVGRNEDEDDSERCWFVDGFAVYDRRLMPELLRPACSSVFWRIPKLYIALEIKCVRFY